MQKENYMRAYRKKTHVTQFDVAFLLGLDENSLLSRWESGERPPSLEAILVYHLLFDTPPQNFFVPQSEIIRQKLITGISQLLSMLKSQDKSANIQQRINYLESVLIRLTNEPIYDEKN